MSQANELADRATRMMAGVIADPLAMAKEFHQLYHVSANTLRQRFHISRKLAREVVRSCQSCVTFIHPPHVGVNPRGLRPNALWQMDVTHVTEFGRLKYVHVSVDTFSGIIYATAMAGERVIHVKTHCLEAWAAWGKSLRLKTDNGPAYASHGFHAFCAQLQVSHSTGLPYNPQGQGIVERANKSLKELLEKQNEGIAEGATPRERLALALFTLNFLNLNDAGETAAERHMSMKDRKHLDMVKWKDVLDNKWYGPDLVITRSRGVVCVFPQNQENPHWVSSRLTRVVLHPKERDEPEVQDDGCLDPDGDPDATMAQQTMPHGEDGTLGGDQSLANADANSC
ncbi:hypothetical protein STEG23_026640 [Scotinomys teguina]